MIPAMSVLDIIAEFDFKIILLDILAGRKKI